MIITYINSSNCKKQLATIWGHFAPQQASTAAETTVDNSEEMKKDRTSPDSLSKSLNSGLDELADT